MLANISSDAKKVNSVVEATGLIKKLPNAHTRNFVNSHKFSRQFQPKPTWSFPWTISQFFIQKGFTEKAIKH
jgi:hypothetical protein